MSLDNDGDTAGDGDFSSRRSSQPSLAQLATTSLKEAVPLARQSGYRPLVQSVLTNLINLGEDPREDHAVRHRDSHPSPD